MRTVGLILAYNTPPMTDRLYESIKSVVKLDFPVIVLDNGSDKDKISKYATHFIQKNCRTTHGFNEGINIACREFKFDNLWFFTSDCYFRSTECPLANAHSYLEKYPQIGIIHPSLHESVNVCYDVKNDGKTKGLKIVSEYDFVCPIFTQKALTEMQSRFNPKLYQGWGLDYESSYIVRKAGMKVAIDHDIVVGHDTSWSYDNGRDKDHANRNSFYQAAGLEMNRVFGEQYGYNWHQIFVNSYNEGVGQIWS